MHWRAAHNYLLLFGGFSILRLFIITSSGGTNFLIKIKPVATQTKKQMGGVV